MPGISRTCACEWDKDFEIDKYLKHCEQIKSLADDLLGTCDDVMKKQFFPFLPNQHRDEQGKNQKVVCTTFQMT